MTLRNILYIIFKNRIVIAVVFFAAVVLSLIYCFCVPAVYRAETRLLVKMGRMEGSALEQYRPESYRLLFQEKAQTICNETELLKGQYLTEKVVEHVGDRGEPIRKNQSMPGKIVDGVKGSIDAIRSWFTGRPADKASAADTRTVLTFLDRLHVTFLEDTDLISIGFDWPDAHFASMVANLYAQEYVAQHRLLYESQRSYRFYNDQMDLYEKKLKDVETRIQAFLSSSDTGTGARKDLLVRRIDELTNRYNQAVVGLIKAQTKLSRIRETALQDGCWAETTDPGGTRSSDKQAYARSLDESYLKLRNERERAQRGRTADGADIKVIDNQLAALRKQKMETLISATRAEVTLAQDKKTALLKEIAAERKKLEDVNSKTVALQELEKERDIAEQSYQVYKKKAEELRISDGSDFERTSSVRIAAPAVVPLVPAYPNRQLIVALSAFAGLFLGLVFSVVRELFNHTFRHDDDVARALGVPLLLSVPLGPTAPYDAALQAAPRAGFEALPRLFWHDFRRPVSTPGWPTSGRHALATAIVVVLCLGGFLFYLYASAAPGSARRQALSLAALYPPDRSRAQEERGVQSPEIVEPALASSDRPSAEAPRIDTLEKRRSALEAELQAIKTEIENSRAFDRTVR